MDQGWGHPLQAKPTGDLVSGDPAPWAGHVIWAAAPLTALGDDLPSPLKGFAREDGGTGRRRLQGEGPRDQVDLGAGFQLEGNGAFLL